MEIWKDIQGYEGLYQVSNLGRVRSLNYGRTRQTRVLALKSAGYGYYGVNLYNENHISTTHYIHRLVAQAFIPNSNNLPQVNHLDEDKSNNAASNLEWCNSQENMSYGTRGRRAVEHTIKPIAQIKNGKVVHIWKSGAEAGRSGFIPTHITQCCKGKKKSHYGYEWRYAT